MTNDSKPLTEGTLRLVLMLLVCLLLGCDEPEVRFPVSGKVLIDGQPLQMGSIRFMPKLGRPFTSKIMADGSFQLSEDSVSTSEEQLGVFPGIYRVAVSSFKVRDESSNNVDWLAPSKYSDFRTSGIEVQVTGPKPDLQIELTWEGDEQTDDVSANDAEEKLEDQVELVEPELETTPDTSQAEEAPEKK